MFPYEDALVTYTILPNYNVHIVLIDDRSVVNILSEDAMTQMDVDFTKLTLERTFFYKN
jgi:hypothetical protein